MDLRLLALLAACAWCASANELLSQSLELQPWLVSTRREFHQFPELMFQEFNTSQRIRSILDELSISYK